MAELKTQETKASALAFIKAVKPSQKRDDALALLAMFQKATGQKSVMWGAAIVGFGKYHYKSERSAQEGFWPLTGFSPRKANLTLYVLSSSYMAQSDNAIAPLLKKLGKFKKGGGCLYINKLADVDAKVLAQLIKVSHAQMQKRVRATPGWSLVK